tara:strand:- start:130 stop:441 length:312 start_codon:yes stop_codon:yes gene_type:complete
MEVRKDCSKSANGPNKYQDLDLFDCLLFFCCPNKIYDSQCYLDIKKYTYCKETNTQPYKGSYSDVPSIWMEKYFTLRNLIDLKELRTHERQVRANKTKGVPLQ